MGRLIWTLLFFALSTWGRMVPPQQVIGPRIVNLEASGLKVDNTEQNDASPGAAIVSLVVQGILESLSEDEISTASLVSGSTTDISFTSSTLTIISVDCRSAIEYGT